MSRWIGVFTDIRNGAPCHLIAEAYMEETLMHLDNVAAQKYTLRDRDILADALLPTHAEALHPRWEDALYLC